MKYSDCKVYSKLKKKEIPIITKVQTDEFTEMVGKNFDYKFDGISKVYPYELPKLPEFKILCIVGASGSGKSTLLKEFGGEYNYSSSKKYNNNAIVSNFATKQEAINRLSAVGLNSMPVWCRPRNVLSVGEGFRADLALNLNSFSIFDEFTSTIDRNVAKSTCNGIKKYIDAQNLTNIVFCSCHKDFISFLSPDFVIDLDTENCYDCRGEDLGETLPCKSTKQVIKTCGVYLGNITI